MQTESFDGIILPAWCHFSTNLEIGVVNILPKVKSIQEQSETAPFDKDFYIILNLAIGGHFDGYRLPPEGFTETSMHVDYVRVFK